MVISNQRLRNLTTGIESIMTHMLPDINDSIQEHLKSQLTDERFWDDLYDSTHTGETEIYPKKL